MSFAHRQYSQQRDGEITPEQSAELPFPFGHGNYGVTLEGPDADGVATITLTSPRLVAANAPVMRRIAVDALAIGAKTLVIDLSHCPMVSGVGAQALASAGFAMRKAQGACVVVGATVELQEWFRACHLTPDCFEVR